MGINIKQIQNYYYLKEQFLVEIMINCHFVRNIFMEFFSDQVIFVFDCSIEGGQEALGWSDIIA